MRVAALILLYASSAWAQFPVSGRIVDDIDGSPVANARVGLINDEIFEISPETSTDNQGRFTLSVPQGTYRLATSKYGFLDYPNNAIQVAVGKPGELSLILTRKRAISARILWSDGEPLNGGGIVDFYTVGTNFRAGGARVASDGQVHAGALGPGLYYFTIERTFIERSAPGRSARQMQYPSPEALARGGAIDLRRRTSAALGDVHIAESTGVIVEGRIRIPKDIPMFVNGPTVSLTNLTGDMVAENFLGQSEEFRIDNVPPGTYYLFGRTNNPRELMFGVRTIQVGGLPIRDLLLELPDSRSVVEGIAFIEGSEGEPAAAAGVRLGISSRPFFYSRREATGADGRFEISFPSGDASILNREYQLTARGASADTYLASVTQDGVAQTREPFLIKASAGPVRLLLKRDTGKILGQVTLPGNPGRPAFAVLRRKDGVGFSVSQTTTDIKGVFRFENLIPGPYELLVFDRQEMYAGEETFRTLQARALTVTVAGFQEVSVKPDIVEIGQ